MSSNNLISGKNKWPFIATCAAAAVLVVGMHGCTETFNDAQRGHDFLKSRGYTEIEGGQRLWMMHTCGRNLAREYNARTPDGTVKKQTVCFTLFGPQLPWF